MFTEKIEPKVYNGVETIDGTYLIPKGIGTVSWSWNDDEKQMHKNQSNNVLYFLDSPVNILSTTALCDSMNDDEEKWVLIERKYSISTWSFRK